MEKMKAEMVIKRITEIQKNVRARYSKSWNERVEDELYFLKQYCEIWEVDIDLSTIERDLSTIESYRGDGNLRAEIKRLIDSVDGQLEQLAIKDFGRDRERESWRTK